MNSTQVFFIIESEDYDDIPYGIAFSESNVTSKEIKSWDSSVEWKPLVMELKTGNPADYLVNDLDIPLVSERLKKIIGKYPEAYLSWYPIEIKDNEKTLIYYYLKINKLLSDCIDYDKSIIKGDAVIRPYFIDEKIMGIFKIDIDSQYLLVSNKLKIELEKQKITGLSFHTWMNDSKKHIDKSIFLSEQDTSVYKTFKGKNYTKEEWEAYEKEQWEKYKGKK